MRVPIRASISWRVTTRLCIRVAVRVIVANDGFGNHCMGSLKLSTGGSSFGVQTSSNRGAKSERCLKQDPPYVVTRFLGSVLVSYQWQISPPARGRVAVVLGVTWSGRIGIQNFEGVPKP